VGASLPVNLILNWRWELERKVISGDDFSASQPVPGGGRKMSTRQTKEKNIKTRGWG
jgi:hypothetical protein